MQLAASMGAVAKWVFFGGVVAAAALGPGGCTTAEFEQGALLSLVGGSAHPDKPPNIHTVDNGGFIDNAGHSSEELSAKPDVTGIWGATELGADRPTGFNTGIPVGARPSGVEEPPPKGWRPLPLPTPGRQTPLVSPP